MFGKKTKQQPKKSMDAEILQKSQLEQLKHAFSDITLGSKGPSSSSAEYALDNVDQPIRETPLAKTFGRIKSTFYDLSSRSFAKYSEFSSHLQIGKIIESRPQLLKMNITVNSLEVLTVLMAFFIPKKWVNKTLLSLFVLTIEVQFMQKLMLNYYLEQIALNNNRMDPEQQEARNLIEYKYRISYRDQKNQKQQQKDPYIQKLLEEVDKKNIEYLKFKKVQLLM